jgi:hypothetical protein
VEDLVTVQRIIAGCEGSTGQGRDVIQLIQQPLGFAFPGNLLAGKFS